MKSPLNWLALLLVMGTALVARADDGGGSSLVCPSGVANVYLPRGDKWFLTPTGTQSSVMVLYQPDGPVQTPALPGATANFAIQTAFNVWTGATCPGNGRPNFRVSNGAYPTRDRGDDPLAGTYQNVVYFVIDPQLWEADVATVALTTTEYRIDNQYDVGADMEFNNAEFQWRVGTTGCTVGNANCYDVETVALHEVGHFIGLNHVACTDAVMFPSAFGTFVNTTLSHHEVAGICALYPPHTATPAGNQQGEACATQGDCATGLTCFESAGAVAANPNAWCAKACSSTNDCNPGWVCGPWAGSTNYCYPGFHLPDVPVVDNITWASDLCATCTDGSQCSTGQCGGIGSNGDGVCTQLCTAPSYACPIGMDCSPSNLQGVYICLPTQPTTCQVLYGGVTLNDTCVQPASTNNPNSAFIRQCESGLNCLQFPGSGVGSCVGACSAVDPTSKCTAGFTCCYGVDTNGGCASSNPANANGGCFQIGHLGDSCVLPNQAICDTKTTCFTPGDSTLARCYDYCPQGTCAAGETCVTNVFGDNNQNPLAVCCDVATWNPANLASCVPHAGPCLREVSVECNVNSDCQSNLCLKSGNTAFCSLACTSDSDCPAAGADVNNDGVADAGAPCTSVGSGKYCVPAGTPVVAPACATVSGNSAKNTDGCSNCASADPMSAEGLAWWSVVVLSMVRARRRRRA